VVLRALAQLKENPPEGTTYIPIYVPVARPISLVELLYEILRRFYEAILDGNVGVDMPRPVAESLFHAYRRTMLKTKVSSRHSSSRAATAQTWAQLLSLSKKESTEQSTEESFRDYSDFDAEHDFLRIVSQVSRPIKLRQSFWERLRGTPAREVRFKLVVVLDELDKMTQTKEGRASLGELLTGIKNILISQEMYFVFVGGPELHDRHVRDVHRGNSIFESVFAWSLYIPCIWQAPEALVRRTVAADFLSGRTCLCGQQSASEHPFCWKCGGPTGPELVANFVSCLRYRGRGIPRRLLLAFNAMVQWQDGRPIIANDAVAGRLTRLYARLEAIVSSFAIENSPVVDDGIDADRKRLTSYYLCDWVLRTTGRSFTVDDIVDEPARAIDPVLRVSKGHVEVFLDHLQQEGIVEKLSDKNAEERIIEDAVGAQAKAYRLKPDVLGEIVEIVKQRRSATLAPRPSTEIEGSAAEDFELRMSGDPRPVESLKNGRYQVRRPIGQGGMGSVYEGWDSLLKGRVAIKILEHRLAADPVLRKRFVREAAIGRQLRHESIVGFVDYVEEGGVLALVMELIEGVDLRSRLDKGPIAAIDAVTIAQKLLDVLELMDKHGVCRIDLKPSNIILRHPTDPVVVDLGIVHLAGDEELKTQLGFVIGTPQYMSPEQIRGLPVDIRTDIWSLGIVLYEMIKGQTPWGRSDDDGLGEVYGVLTGSTIQTRIESLVIEEPLKGVVRRALSVALDERYRSPDEMRRDLALVVEALKRKPIAKTLVRTPTVVLSKPTLS
jgi:serine/threonine-protein kinase